MYVILAIFKLGLNDFLLPLKNDSAAGILIRF